MTMTIEDLYGDFFETRSGDLRNGVTYKDRVYLIDYCICFGTNSFHRAKESTMDFCGKEVKTSDVKKAFEELDLIKDQKHFYDLGLIESGPGIDFADQGFIYDMVTTLGYERWNKNRKRVFDFLSSLPANKGGYYRYHSDCAEELKNGVLLIERLGADDFRNESIKLVS